MFYITDADDTDVKELIDDAEDEDQAEHKKRKKKTDDDFDDRLEDDDYELLEENLGVKLKRVITEYASFSMDITCLYV